METKFEGTRGRVAAIVVAAGKGTRMATGARKQFRLLGSKPVFLWSVEAFSGSEVVDEIVVVTARDQVSEVAETLRDMQKVKSVIPGGQSRQESVALGLAQVSQDVAWVLVHDGVRPLVTKSLIKTVLDAAKETGAAAPGIAVSDTIKRVTADGDVLETVDRSELRAVQTPQAFSRALLERAHNACENSVTDDCGLVEAIGAQVRIVPGDPHNVKITTERDWEAVCALIERRKEIAVGFGFDVHRLERGRPLVLGGVRLDHPWGLAGHSDADVLCHAVIDGIFGAAGLDDIGTHFPDTDERYRGADSLALLQEASGNAKALGHRVLHVDAFISAEAPKLRPYIQQMRENLARAIGIEPSRVNVKAGTGEGAGPVGRAEVIEARAVVTLEKADTLTYTV